MIESQAAFSTEPYDGQDGEDRTTGLRLDDVRWPEGISELIDARNMSGRGYSAA